MKNKARRCPHITAQAATLRMTSRCADTEALSTLGFSHRVEAGWYREAVVSVGESSTILGTTLRHGPRFAPRGVRLIRRHNHMLGSKVYPVLVIRDSAETKCNSLNTRQLRAGPASFNSRDRLVFPSNQARDSTHDSNAMHRPPRSARRANRRRRGLLQVSRLCSGEPTYRLGISASRMARERMEGEPAGTARNVHRHEKYLVP